MNSAIPIAQPIATVLVLPDLRPLAARILSAIRDLTSGSAAAFDLEAERTGRVVVFRGEPDEARRLDRELRRAGLTTSINTLA